MEKSIFRKKSMDKINSPENLDDYIRVTGPSLWLILGAIIALLIGFCAWGALGTIETRTIVGAVVSDGNVVCQCNADILSSVKKRLDNGEKVIFEMNGQQGSLSGYDEETWAVYGNIRLEDTIGSAEIIENIKPMSLLFK